MGPLSAPTLLGSFMSWGQPGQGKRGTSAPEELSKSGQSSAKMGIANEDTPNYQLN